MVTKKNQLKMMLSLAVDYFIHPSLFAEADKLYRARILTAVLLIFSVELFCSLSIVWLARFPAALILTSAIVGLPALACFVVLLSIMRSSGSYLFSSIATVLVVLIQIIFGVSVTGGAAYSPLTQLLAIPLLTSYFFGGIRWGGYTAGAVFLTLLIFIGLHQWGVKFPRTIDTEEQWAITQFLVGFINIAVIAGLAFTYEYTTSMLRWARDLEHEKYIHLAKTDPLTGLANRRDFDGMLAERIALYAGMKPPRRFALGYLDLDGFKPINDCYGHAIGDEVLRIVSERLRAALRDSDFVGRHGGDEFMLMLDSVNDQESLEAMAERMLNSIAQPIVTSAAQVQITGSLGFAMFPLDAADINALKYAADTAMYEAKHRHNTWCLYRSVET